MKLLFAALLLGALAGCTSTPAVSPSPSGAPSRSPVAGTSAAAPPVTVEQLMEAAGCNGKIIKPQLYTLEVGRCTVNGSEVDVAVFSSNDKRDAWVKFASEFSEVTYGDRWAAASLGAAGVKAFEGVAP